MSQHLINLFYLIKGSSSTLVAVFKNYSHQATINNYSGISFTCLVGFGYLVDTNITYYALDWTGNKIIIYDKNWQYLTFKIFTRPTYMITVNNSLYISGDNSVYKTDKYLNITGQSATACYRGLFYNSKSNTIFVAGYYKYTIDVFDLNLNLVDSIPTTTYQPYSVQGYKNYIYVGTMSGHLLVIENKVIIQTATVCAGTQPTAIIIDNFGFMALGCYYKNSAQLYYSSNVSYTGFSFTYTVNPYFVNFDSNGRFIVISPSQINIYN